LLLVELIVQANCCSMICYILVRGAQRDRMGYMPFARNHANRSNYRNATYQKLLRIEGIEVQYAPKLLEMRISIAGLSVSLQPSS
jgi:hypothetical protein